jgi:hypothetical protein
MLGGAVRQGNANKVLPRWQGVALIVFLPVAVALGMYGNIWIGLVQVVLGYVLWSRRGAPAEQSSRVWSSAVNFGEHAY